MSITIRFKGCLAQPSQKNVFFDEMLDICKSMDWACRMTHEKEVTGLLLAIHSHCQNIPFLFDVDGCLYANGKDEISLNTQFTSADIHMTLIELLLYLGKKYFKDFELYDDTGYAKNKDPKNVQVFFENSHYNLTQIRKLLADHTNCTLQTQTNYLVSNKMELMLQKRLKNVLLHRIVIKSGIQ